MRASINHPGGSHAVLLSVLLAALAPLPSAAAQTAIEKQAVFFEGPVVLPESARVETLVAFEGPTRVNGVVQRDVIAIDGDVDVAGHVGGDVIAMDGLVRLAPSARVGGDLLSASPPSVAEGAQVGGAIRTFEATRDDGAGVLGWFLSWLGMVVLASLLAFLLHFFVPARTKKMTYRTARTDPWRSLGVGALIAVALPLLALLAIVTVIGIPVGIVLFLVAGLVAFFGFVVGGFILGGAIAERSHRGATWSPLAWIFIGVAILSALTLVPVLGTLVWIAASLYGVGAAALTGWNARQTRLGRTPTTPRAPEPPPEPTTTRGPIEQQPAGA